MGSGSLDPLLLRKVRRRVLACCQVLPLVALLCCASVIADHTPKHSDDVYIGVLAWDEPALIRQQLEPFFEAVNSSLPSYDLHLEIMDLERLEQAISSNRIHVFLTNPYHYLLLRDSGYLAGAFATINRQALAGSVASLGGTVVVRADRSDLLALGDLRDRTVAIADRRSAGGFVLPLAELQRIGIKETQISWAELGNQRRAIDAVLAGTADAAFLRSSYLEVLVNRGELDPLSLRVLNRQLLGDYPFAVSTRLYPEWPLVFLGGADPDLLAGLQGQAMVLSYQQGSDTLGGVSGLGAPADYSALGTLLRAMVLPPYDQPPVVPASDIWRSYRLEIMGSLLAAILVIGLLLGIIERNRRLKQLWIELSKSLRAREQDRQRIADLNRHFELFLDRTTDFVYFKDAERRFVFVSGSFATLVGLDRNGVVGKTDEDVFPAHLAADYLREEEVLLEARQPIVDQRQRFQRPDGSMGWVSTYKWPVLSPDGESLVGLFGISRDVTESHDYEKQLERAANYDALTGLPNRSLFFDRLTQAMASTERRGTELALVYMDIDNFKDINDQYGHAVGDELLIKFSQLLSSELRRADTVARLGGDEFVLLLPDFQNRKECLHLIDRLMKTLSLPQTIAGHRMQLTASAGLAFFGKGDDTYADHLLRQADQAMYRAKQAGRNRYRLLDDEEDEQLRAFLARVEQAMAEHRFELHYQPLVDMCSGAIKGVEALLRWRIDADGLLMPEEFLPMLLGHPLAQELEKWVVREALEQQGRWRGNGLSLRMHVNVTASAICRPGFAKELRTSITREMGDARDCLTLEILESAVVADSARINEIIEDCREFGVQFALDDFGTGYSSLSHIKDLRADAVKIDRRFVQSMYTSYDDFSLLAAILSMARAFDREVVAEGVETIEQGELLLQLGCRVAQGFCIAHAMPAADFESWAASWQTQPSWKSLSERSTALPDDWAAGRSVWLSQMEKRPDTGE
ncbi:MAG: diguanylate cyclase (GGDEF)-like protein/PAS domain S-box-containing protein [Halieaceae bacterium]